MHIQRLGLLPIIAVTGLLAAACTEPPAETSGGEVVATLTEPPAGQLPAGVVPTHYTLDLTIDPRETRFSGRVAIAVEIAAPTESIWLHGLGLEVTEAYALDPAKRRIEAVYAQALDSGVASVTLAEALPQGSATLHFVYSAPFNTSVNALFRAERGADTYAASQLQPVAGRQIFPSFDEPRFKTPFDVLITARADDRVITNSPETASTELVDGWVRHEFAPTPPLPTYLLAFAIGPYEVVDAPEIPANAIRMEPVPLRGVAARNMGARFGISLSDTPDLIAALEDYFGIPYPYAKLDLIAMPASFGGAMENAGAITYDERLILLGDDPPLQQRRFYLNVHAHELAHMWFGDLVTPDWWTDIWLNESFASWMANKIAQAHWPEGEFDRATLRDAMDAMATDSLASTRRIREPVLRNEEIEDSFDSITYEKGGGVLAMFENYLGEEAFRAGVRLHMERFAHSVADADQFIESLAQGSGQRGIVESFRSFIDQPGVPVVEAQLQCALDAAPRIELRQRRYAPLGSAIDAEAQQWQIPVCVAYDTADAPGRVCTLLTERAATLDLDLDGCPSAIHPNSHGAGYYRFTLDDAGWAALVGRAAALEPAEALTLVDSLRAAFRAGTVSARSFIDGLAALAAHPAWDVATETVRMSSSVLAVLDGEERERAEAALRAIYRPRYDALDGATDESSVLLRVALTQFLALDVDDPDLRAELGALADRTLDAAGRFDSRAAPADILQTVLTVGVQDRGAPFFDRLVEAAIASEDPYFKNAAFAALGRVEDPELSARLQAAILEQRFPLTDTTGMLIGQLAADATRDATWDWVNANADAVIALVPEFFRSQVVPRFGLGFCSPERAAEVEAFVVSHAALLPGHERSLSQTLEAISLCAALKSEKGAELAAAFAEPASR
jgi:alanyl aminopeptidase